MKRAIAIAMGILGYAYLRLCFVTSRYIVTSAAEAVLRRTWDVAIPTVFACWHDQFLISPLSLQCRRFPKPLFVTNDSFGGVFLQTICRLLASPFVVIGLAQSRETRLDSLTLGLARYRRMTIAADYGDPWYRARSSARILAERTGGCVVAMRLEPRRKWRLRVGAGHAYLPLPFSAYAISLGEPRVAADFRLEADLNELEATNFFSEARASSRVEPADAFARDVSATAGASPRQARS